MLRMNEWLEGRMEQLLHFTESANSLDFFSLKGENVNGFL